MWSNQKKQKKKSCDKACLGSVWIWHGCEVWPPLFLQLMVSMPFESPKIRWHIWVSISGLVFFLLCNWIEIRINSTNFNGSIKNYDLTITHKCKHMHYYYIYYCTYMSRTWQTNVAEEEWEYIMQGLVCSKITRRFV